MNSTTGLRSKSRCSAKAVPRVRLIVEGIDLSAGILGRPDLRCIAIVEGGEVKLLGSAPESDQTATAIYPTGWGRFAIGSPDGSILEKGSLVEVELSGSRLTGTVGISDHGDYLHFPDGSRCGLTAGMRVVVWEPSNQTEGDSAERTRA
jgi:hypothetical protein